jgi:lipopolysaccharide/colanic/teichoic acid biosynthesis glycosyltransferase
MAPKTPYERFNSITECVAVSGTAKAGVQDQVAPGIDCCLAIPVHSGVGLTIKRIIDIVGSLLMLACIAPFVPIIILAIEIDSPGPILFRPRIIGYRGREFWTYKFRTMDPDAFNRLLNDQELLTQYKQNLKLKNDPRITRVGRFLRKTSLDEMPQLWSVLKGDLSLVGPRMLAQLELEKFGPYRDKILSVKPGLAGLWVASGRQSVDFSSRLKLELEYVDCWSIWLDFWLLIKTFWVMIRMVGAH